MTRFTSLFVLVALILCCGSEAQQLSSPASAEIVGVQVNTWVAIVVSVSSPTESVVIATCGAEEVGPESICQSTGHLEVKRNAKWRPVERRNSDRIFGQISQDKWHPLAIARGNRHMFEFGYLKGEFAIHPGEQLRLVIDTWQDANAMRGGLHPSTLISESFKAPQ